MVKREEPTVDTALEVLETTRVGRWGKTLPPHVIRAVLAAHSEGPNHLFLRLAVDDAGDDKQLVRSWQRALQAVVDCNQYDSWGSKTRRDRTRALAKNARILAAIQGTVAHLKEPSSDMLAVLVADGSAASIDALVAHVSPDNLDLWKRLRTHAKRTPALDALFAEVDGGLVDRNATSPALALGPVIGLGRVETLWFDASINSSEGTGGGVPRVQCHVHVDSRDARWFTVSLTDLGRNTVDDWRHTNFDHEKLSDNSAKLGRCEPREVPAWLRKAAGKLGIAWSAAHVRGGVRGAKRDLVASWLAGK